MHRVCVSSAGGQEGAGQPGHLRWRGKSRKARGLHAVPGQFHTAHHQQLLSSLRLSWRGNGRKRALGHKRVQLEKGLAEGSKTTASPSTLRPGSAKLSRSLQSASGKAAGCLPSATRDLRAAGQEVSGHTRQDGTPPPLRTPFMGLQMLTLPLERHQALDLRTLTRF